LRRHGWLLPLPPVRDEILQAHRLVTDRQFKHAEEHHTTGAGASAVAAKHELIEVTEQVGFVVGAMVGPPQQPSLDQRDNAVHGGQQLVRIVAPSSGGALAAPIMRS
jgi:hypothetical protein